LFSIASHPDDIKRVGAAITFKNIYKDFREESSLISRYALSIIYKLLLSLRLTSSNVYQVEVFDVIDKYTTIVLKSVKEKDDIGSLLASNKLRDFPQNVEELVAWSWTNCTNPNLYFRRGCMNCFDILMCLVQWPNHSSESKEQTSIAEDTMLGSIDKQIEVALKDIDHVHGKGLNIVAGIADFLQWTVSKNFVKPVELLSIDTNTKKRKADNFDSISLALSTFSSFIESSSLIENRSVMEATMIMDLDQNITTDNMMRSEVFRRILEFLLLCMEKDRVGFSSCLISNGLWGPSMQSLIIRSIMRSNFDNLFPSKSTVCINMDIYLKPIISKILTNLTTIESTCTETDKLKYLFISYVNKFVNKLRDPTKLEEDDLISIINTIDMLEKNNALNVLLDLDCLLELKSVGKNLLIFALNSASSDDPIIVKICATIMAYTIKLNCVPFVSDDNQMTILSCLQSVNGFYFYKRHMQQLTNTIIDRCRVSLIQDLNIIPFLFKAACSSLLNQATKDIMENNEADAVIAITLNSMDLLIKECALVPNIAVASIISKCVAFLNDFSILPTLVTMRLVVLDSKMSFELRNSELRKVVCRDVLKTLGDSNNLSIISIVAQIELLPYLVNGSSSHSCRPVTAFDSDSGFNEEVVDSLEEMVASKFPLDWEHHDPKSNAGGDFISLFGAYRRAVIQSGAPCLLKPLFPTFREGIRHPYHRYVTEMFQSLVESIDVSDGGIGLQNVDFVCSFCFDLFKNDYEDYEIKELFCDRLCLPLLRRCTSDTLSKLFVSSKKFSMSILSSSNLSLVKKLVDSINFQPVASQKTNLFITSFIYSVFEILYSRCHLHTIKDLITKGYNPNAVRDNELTVIVTKCITDNCLNADLESNDTECFQFIQRMFSTAFSCITTIISKTQSNLAFYEKILFNENKYWVKAINCNVVYIFQKALNKPFQTEFISNSTGTIKLITT